MLEKIYKEKIKKTLQKVFDLWWSELVAIQGDFSDAIEKIFERIYNEALKKIESNVEVKMNDALLENIAKTVEEDDISTYKKYFEDSFSIGSTKLDASIWKEPWVQVKLGVKQQDAVDYAQSFAWTKIQGIDDYTTTRINKLVSDGIEKWWGYNRIAKELKNDYAFWTYRANLIASQEVGESYLNWKDVQFKRYRKEYGVDGWKQWQSHRDAVTTPWCMHNDFQWWIPYSQDFESEWNKDKPTRFIGCRCNLKTKLFNLDEQERLTVDNEPEFLKEQGITLEDKWFTDGIKPKNYNKLSTLSVPASYFNEIWMPSEFIGKWRGFYRKSVDGSTTVVNIGKRTASEVEKKFTEAHEVGHFFFEEKILKDSEKLEKFLWTFKSSFDELQELTKDKTFYKIATAKYTNATAKLIKENVDDIASLASYKVSTATKKVKRRWRTYEVQYDEVTERFKEEVGAFQDTIGALTKQKLGAWHSYWYYTSQASLNKELLVWTSMFWSEYNVTRMQAHEFFAHLNETHFLDNKVLKAMMPKTYEAMKSFYEENWFSF